MDILWFVIFTVLLIGYFALEGANIGLGVGGVALLVGSYLFITGKNDKTEPGSPSTPQQVENKLRPRVSFGVAPTIGGAQGAVFGSF